MEKIVRELMLAKICATATKADCSKDYGVGTTFSFDSLADSRAGTARAVIKKVLETMCRINFENLLHFGPYKVVYVATGAPADLICQDSDGDHFYLPSGVVHLLRLCEVGEYPPALPGEETPESGGMPSPKEMVESLLEGLKKTA